MPGGLTGTGSRGGLVGIDDIGAGQVGTADLADNSVTTAKIAANAVGNTDLRDSAACSVIGRSANSVGDPADIAASADGQFLGRAAGALSFQLVGVTSISHTTATYIPYSDGTTLVTSAELSYATSTGTFDVAKSHSGSTVTSGARNTSNTADSAAMVLAEVAGASGGNPTLRMSVAGVTTWDWVANNASGDQLELVRNSSGAFLVVTSSSEAIYFQPSTSSTRSVRLDYANAAGGFSGGTRLYAAVHGANEDLQFFADLSALEDRGVAALVYDTVAATWKRLWKGVNRAGPPILQLVPNGGTATLGGIWQGAKGADVASAGTITLGGDGNLYDITGATAIDYITTTGIQAGTIVTVQFDSNPVVNHNTGSVPANTAAILLAGAANFSTGANDTLTLIYDGTTWRELARTVI